MKVLPLFAMLAVATALETSGAIHLVVDAIAPGISGLPPFLIIWAVYLLTSVLSELINHAVAVVLTELTARPLRRFFFERSRDFTICRVLSLVSFTSAGEGGTDRGTRTDPEGGAL